MLGIGINICDFVQSSSNSAPVAAWASPAANAVLTVGVATTLRGTATDSDGAVSSAAFYADAAHTIKIGDAAPVLGGWECSYTPAAGDVSLPQLYFVAIDNSAAASNVASRAFSITTRPSVTWVSPTAGTALIIGNAATLRCTATDDGSVAALAYYRDAGCTDKIGDATLTGGNWDYSWSPVSGDASVTAVYARATDNLGVTSVVVSRAMTVVTNEAAQEALLAAVSTEVFAYNAYNYSTGVFTDRSGNGKNSSAGANSPSGATDSSDTSVQWVAASSNSVIVPASAIGSSFTKATVYAVVRRTAASQNYYLFSKDSNGFAAQWTSTNTLKMYLGSTSNYVLSTSIGTDTNVHILCFWYDGTQGTAANRGEFYLDDMATALSKSAPGGTPAASIAAATNMWIGANSAGTTYAGMHIFSLRAFVGAAHDATARGNVKSYLQALHTAV